ncbi:hypothetical protein HNP46_004172 [Pseudomonas nitritireducens]|uniref:Arc-like DNA binding domain-containing protein n=1 Tax=Pseudomonas nitroreducens TaxID=46680 RepID=A0A7W7KMN8_PSENT|nr:Arc family DNA-binding protein [Pseudomonas nitritireducens]MBB4865291.1 hypothetical protein [Pseudomonas nitritireducens]
MASSPRKVYQLRLPPFLRAKIDSQADASNRSVNAQIVWLLEQSFDLWPKLEGPIEGEDAIPDRKPFGLRMPPSLKTTVEDASNASGYVQNLEMIRRLLAMCDAQEKILADVKYTPTSLNAVDLQRAWENLSREIDNVVSRDVDQSTGNLSAAKKSFSAQLKIAREASHS